MYFNNNLNFKIKGRVNCLGVAAVKRVEAWLPQLFVPLSSVERNKCTVFKLISPATEPFQTHYKLYLIRYKSD